jgi:putative ABC transport system substrate-binding protein
MRRRGFIALLGSAVAWPLVARAQQPKKVVRIGWLGTGFQGRLIDAFRQELGGLGYVEGANLAIEYRQAESKVERFPALAGELVGLKVDLIVATNSLAARAVQRATSTIPVVVPVMGDPVRDGLVSSLARPGSNITGLTFLGPELLAKRLALLKEALPSASRIAALWHPEAYGASTMGEMLKAAEDGARSLAVALHLVPAHGPDDFVRAFSEIAGGRPGALLIFPSPMLFTELRRIADLAAQQRLPAMAMGREFAEFGGLMAYGASLADLHRRAAAYVYKILQGAKPDDLTYRSSKHRNTS